MTQDGTVPFDSHLIQRIIAGQKFNVGSPAQLGEILFDKMELPGGKKGKTGKYSTPADVLEDLATEHELPGRVLDWRQVQKLKSTYTDALQDHINRDTGRVHTSYSIAGASTGACFPKTRAPSSWATHR